MGCVRKEHDYGGLGGYLLVLISCGLRGGWMDGRALCGNEDGCGIMEISSYGIHVCMKVAFEDCPLATFITYIHIS